MGVGVGVGVVGGVWDAVGVGDSVAVADEVWLPVVTEDCAESSRASPVPMTAGGSSTPSVTSKLAGTPVAAKPKAAAMTSPTTASRDRHPISGLGALANSLGASIPE